jgi:SAM-dependent methyltransferase
MMFGFRDVFSYFQCSACECLQIANVPEDISKYYPNNYYSLVGEDESRYRGFRGQIRLLTLSAWVFNKTWRDRLIQKFYHPVSLRVLKDLGVNVNTRILDVGCGNGQKFLFPLAELGFKNLAGCDPFLSSDIKYQNGLEIRKSDIFNFTGTWDIITYHHVFEHVPNPLENLRKIRELLDDDGVCILRIPTVSSYAWEHYRTNWVQLDAPRHFFLHSVKSIEFLAGQAGLRLVRIEYDSTYAQFADSERYMSDQPLRQHRPKGFFNFLKRKINKLRFKRLAERMNAANRGDQAAFFFKKIV